MTDLGVTDPRLGRLIDLLPVELLREDRAAGGRLEALLRLLAAAANDVEDDLYQLYDDLFVETADEWVVPYLAELLGTDVIWDPSRTDDAATATAIFPELASRDLRAPIGPAGRARADVARTISYRRRKGTIAVIEEIARNVSGWPTHAVEGLALLQWNWNANHVRPTTVLADLRTPEVAERVGTPFEATMHTPDVRPTTAEQGRYNVRNVTIHAWRLLAHPLVFVPAVRDATRTFGWTFSPLGNSAPLFSRWRRESDRSVRAGELDVPQPIRRTRFAADLAEHLALEAPRRSHTELYGEFDPVSGDPAADHPDASLVVYRNGTLITPLVDATAPPSTAVPSIVCRRLDPWPAAAPAGPVIHVDVVAGRLAVGSGFGNPTNSVHVSYHTASASTIGGGGYPRPQWLLGDPTTDRYHVGRRPGTVAPAGAPLFTSVTAALAQWSADGSPDAVISVLDSETYDVPATLSVPNTTALTIEAADRERPLLVTPAGGMSVTVPGVAGIVERNATLTLSGVVLAGHVEVTGQLRRLRLWHSTLVPGRRLDTTGAPMSAAPSVRVAAGALGTDADRLRIEIAYSILGRIVCPDTADGVWLLDSILDATDRTRTALGGLAAADPGPPLVAERSTVVGRLLVAALDASSCLFDGPIDTTRTQQGCVRFSYIRPDAVTPRRFRCQPELAVRTMRRDAKLADPSVADAELDARQAAIERRIIPRFTDLRYGRAAYGQLHERCPVEIRTGGADGAEMGVLNHVKQPQRESNIMHRVAEYLPFGLDATIVYET